MVDVDIGQAKSALRLQAHAARAALSPTERAEASAAVARLFFDNIKPYPEDVIAAFWPIRDELDCQPIMVRLMEANYTLVLPAVLEREQALEMRVWEQGASLYAAGFGTLAPSPLAPTVVPDVVLLPLLGFDALGTRLGYGGGYYDRTLASLPKKPKLVGLAFAAQELPLIPREPHDVALDIVITEAGVRQFGPSA
ncbi:5-formyltetrahydrofolate cyclo-ligase [Devosia submarina]|uniref:5-formyltetrahydrofolate cyclo-ligase n=1 Tax=Devosia submarina TaxID=1173082 RepID=UPI000D34F659|nr:5-formyltetrahydrofolate cyclo-ligase [Devosia submarina]